MMRRWCDARQTSVCQRWWLGEIKQRVYREGQDLAGSSSWLTLIYSWPHQWQRQPAMSWSIDNHCRSSAPGIAATKETKRERESNWRRLFKWIVEIVTRRQTRQTERIVVVGRRKRMASATEKSEPESWRRFWVWRVRLLLLNTSTVSKSTRPVTRVVDGNSRGGGSIENGQVTVRIY